MRIMSELEFRVRFSNNLKDKLEDFNMTQKDLSYDTGISEATISYYLSGERMPSVKNVINIACCLYCDIKDLVPTGVFIE